MIINQTTKQPEVNDEIFSQKKYLREKNETNETNKTESLTKETATEPQTAIISFVVVNLDNKKKDI